MIATVCSMLIPRTASAQPVKVHPKAVEAKEAEARQHFKQGRDFLDAGAYAEAIGEFETSLALMPLPELLFNIGQAYRLKGDAKRALEMYKRFIEVIPDGQVADEARANIAALTKQISDAELEAVAIEAARQRYETEREDRAHRRRIGYVMLGVGGALFLAGGAISGAGRGEGAPGVVGAGCVFLGVFGVIPYGAVKILYNLDPGPFGPPPTSTIAKGVAFAFTF
jgi:tetratricopeptide (TPR) repeat protein